MKSAEEPSETTVSKSAPAEFTNIPVESPKPAAPSSSPVASASPDPSPSSTAVSKDLSSTYFKIAVNGGTPSYTDLLGNSIHLEGQSSRVLQLLVAFSSAVTLEEGALEIMNLWEEVEVLSGYGPSRSEVKAIVKQLAPSSNEYLITFSEGTNSANLILDGYYAIKLNGAKAKDLTGLPIPDQSITFYSLFGNDGDLIENGDGTSLLQVGADDLAAYAKAFGSNSFQAMTKYFPMFDWDLSGTIDSSDSMMMETQWILNDPKPTKK